jgi:hypothetical protein
MKTRKTDKQRLLVAVAPLMKPTEHTPGPCDCTQDRKTYQIIFCLSWMCYQTLSTTKSRRTNSHENPQAHL